MHIMWTFLRNNDTPNFGYIYMRTCSSMCMHIKNNMCVEFICEYRSCDHKRKKHIKLSTRVILYVERSELVRSKRGSTQKWKKFKQFPLEYNIYFILYAYMKIMQMYRTMHLEIEFKKYLRIVNGKMSRQ